MWAAGPPHISIDSNGNLTSKTEGSTTWTYEWNAENQLTRVLTNGSEVARYKYDPLGRRVEKVAGGTTTTWAYANEDILREATGGTSWKYVHGPTFDEPLAKEDNGGALTYYHADGLGSVTKVTAAGGGVVTSYSYDAFGVMTGGGAGPSYTGREWDPAAQLLYYRARYYDARIGRFISEDAFGEGYVYVRNQPTVLVDPLGLQGIPDLNGPGFASVCALSIYNQVHAMPVPPRQRHCLASCMIATQCGRSGPPIAAVTGYGKEGVDVLWCLITRDPNACYGAWQDEDIDDNEVGRACPAATSCDTWCDRPEFQGPGGPGPLWPRPFLWRGFP